MNKFQTIMQTVSADAVLLFTEVACNYLSRFATTDGFVAVAKDKAVLYTDGRYIEAARKRVTACKVALRTDSTKDMIAFLSSVGAKTVAVETALPYRQIEHLREKLQGIAVVPDRAVDDAIAAMREVKNEEEQTALSTAQRITETAFDHILGFIRPGVSDLAIAAELEYVMRKNGAEGLSFDTISITGPDTSMPHGVPNGRVVQTGDFVTMDFGAVYGAMHADMTRTVAVGSVSAEQQAVYDTVLQAQIACLDGLHAGMTGKQADALARRVIEQAGYGEYFTHSTGHSVGYEIHESPNLSPSSTAVLQAGNCVTVEPGIYLPGRFGVRIEDMVCITADGCQNFTKAPKQLIVL